ncbi:MAG: glycosyltransferase family 4 protein [Candidatus Buchananbacteria bacterium]|nr:glycosyltransferase family 4 protein [Candidatus Buchananbacteria bacterium]
MRIINISLDQSLLDAQSLAHQRLVAYGQSIDEYVVVVPAMADAQVQAAEHLSIVGVGGNKILQLVKIFKFCWRLTGERHFDQITVQDPYYLSLIAWVIAHCRRSTFEVQIHGFEKENWLRTHIAQWTLRHADVIRVVSQRLKCSLIDKYHLAEHKIIVIPVFTPITINKRSTYEISNPIFTFLTVARLVPVKNISLQLRALAILKRDGVVCRLQIVGDGPLRVQLQAEANTLGLVDQVEFVGWQDKLAPYYGAADAFLLTSEHEGWGLVVIEAAATSLPIIMTDVGCAGEVIHQDREGLIIPVGDLEALVAAMKRLATDQGLRQRLGEAAMATVATLPSYKDLYINKLKHSV